MLLTHKCMQLSHFSVYKNLRTFKILNCLEFLQTGQVHSFDSHNHSYYKTFHHCPAGLNKPHSTLIIAFCLLLLRAVLLTVCCRVCLSELWSISYSSQNHSWQIRVDKYTKDFIHLMHLHSMFWEICIYFDL